MKCFVPGCGNTTQTTGSFFSYNLIPRNPQRRLQWLKAIGRRPDTFVIGERVCSDHFLEEDMYIINNRRFVKDNAIPSKNLPEQPDASSQSTLPPLLIYTYMAVPELPSTKAELCINSKASTSASSVRSPIKGVKRSHKQALEGIPTKTSVDSIGTFSSATSSTKKRLTKFFHNYSKSPLHYKKEINSLTKRLHFLKKKYNTAVRTNKRRRKAVTSLKEVLVDLKKYSLSPDAITNLESTFSDVPLHLMKRMLTNAKTQKNVIRSTYPKPLKHFAMTLQFYSSKAYNYVRQTFNLALPAPSTIRSWLTKVDCTPGFTKPALDAIKTRVTNFKTTNEGRQLFACLMLDEMSIRKEISSERKSQNIWGYVDVGAEVEVSNDRDQASEVLVLMVVGVNDNFKVPIGYFFINKLNGLEKANIVREALINLNETGIKILALTCDGPYVHFKMMTELGCQITNPEAFETFFKHPVDGSNVYVVFDVCHMLKLVRNNWSNSRICLDGSGNEIKWDYIEKLHALQDEKGLYVGNKLRKKHVEWKKSIMKVNLAAQTLSASVADALEFLCKDLELEDFKDVMPTVIFIRKINNLFDILNSRNPFGKYMHTPLRVENEDFWRPKVDDSIAYLKELKDENGKYIYQTQKKVPILGLLISTTSLLAIFDDECKKNGSLKYVLTYKFSPDHLHLFFNGVRSRNGQNNNPSCLQFFYTYRRMLMHIDIKNNDGNCLPQDNTNVLAIPVGNHEISDIHNLRNREEEVQKLEQQDIDLILPTTFDEFTENVVSYISGYVIKSIMKKLSCLKCIEALTSHGEDNVDTLFQLICRKTHGGLLYPSRSVCCINNKIERKIQCTIKILGGLPPKDTLINVLLRESQSFLLNSNIFPTLEDHIFDYAPYEVNHKKKLIDLIIRTYSSSRINSAANKINETISGEKVRKTLAKLVLFKHQ